MTNDSFLQECLDERTLQHKVQHENALRLLRAIETAIQQAEEDGQHIVGNEIGVPSRFYQTLSTARMGF